MTRLRRPPPGPPSPLAGIFRPQLPSDSQAVVQLFVIAARAVCAQPAALDAVHGRLEQITRQLVAPEVLAAQEAWHLWRLFARVAQLPKAPLRYEAGRAYWRDLDGLSQRLDLPPLHEWDALPDGIDDAEAALDADPQVPLSQTLEATRMQARRHRDGLPQGEMFPAEQTLQLLLQLGQGERRGVLEQLIGQGILGRSDVNLLIRFLIKGDAVQPSDTTLNDVLQRVGRWLAR